MTTVAAAHIKALCDAVDTASAALDGGNAPSARHALEGAALSIAWLTTGGLDRIVDDELQEHAFGLCAEADEALDALKAGRSDDAAAALAIIRAPRCRVCLCTQLMACTPSCSWVEEDLCSRCDP